MNVPCAGLPAASVAEHVTVVVPTGNVLPEAGSQVTGTEPSTASLAVAVKLTAAPVADVASAVMSAGSVRSGAVVSATVTTNDFVPGLPAASVAVQSTVVSPIGNVLPLAGVHVAVTAPSTSSVAAGAS